MNQNQILSASILSADFTQLASEIKEAEKAGSDWIHIDVMDGHFVPNLTMGPFIAAACRRATNIPLDVHLMIENPGDLLPAFVEAGADTISIHIETGADIPEAVKYIQAQGCRASIALNPDTPAAAVSEFLPVVDQVLVMTVHPGYSGQEFISDTLPKIIQIRKQLDEVNPGAQVEVDGGINQETIADALAAGAEIFVAASAIFKHPQGIAAGVHALRKQFTG